MLEETYDCFSDFHTFVPIFEHLQTHGHHMVSCCSATLDIRLQTNRVNEWMMLPVIVYGGFACWRCTPPVGREKEGLLVSSTKYKKT